MELSASPAAASQPIGEGNPVRGLVCDSVTDNLQLLRRALLRQRRRTAVEPDASVEKVHGVP